MPRTKAKAEPAADFDETTPPPRGRPMGIPVTPFMTLPPGEVDRDFAEWDRNGRIAEGSILARFEGLTKCYGCESGYLFASGKPIPVATANTYRVAVTIRVKPSGQIWVVLSPLEGSR